LRASVATGRGTRSAPWIAPSTIRCPRPSPPIAARTASNWRPAAFTLSLERARRQATGRRGVGAADPRIFALHAVKRDVALAFVAADEGEIVMFPAPRVDLRARRLIELAN